MTDNNPQLSDLAAQLAQINQKLDYVVERQRMIEDLIDEMTPVARDVLNVGAVKLGELEAKGYFAVGSELLEIVDQVVQAYGPGEVHSLGENIVGILDTLRNVTQPDVLAVANDATDVLHNADKVAPIGPFGMARASNDPDVQHGLAIAVEVLKKLGQIRGGAQTPQRRPQTVQTGDRPALPEHCAVVAPTPPSTEPVAWEGYHFDANGFLLDPTDWNEALADKMAVALCIELTADHWTLLRWARQDFLETGASPNVRRVAAGSGLGVKRVYQLFPKSPGKTAAMIAGIPKPVGCV